MRRSPHLLVGARRGMTTAIALTRQRMGDDARVRRAIDEHYDALWRFLRRMGVTSPHVEDAAQQVFIVYARTAATSTIASERSFLFGTAMRVAADFRRKVHVTREVADENALVREAHAAPDAETELSQRELLGCIDMVLERIPPEFRSVFILAELEELTMAEIAEVLEIAPGTVASRLRRARQLFEEHALEVRRHVEKGS